MIQANAFKIPLADKSIHMGVTSPPYYSLRKYAGEQEFVFGGDKDCAHSWGEKILAGEGYAEGSRTRWQHVGGRDGMPKDGFDKNISKSGPCIKCNAWRGAYGLEPTLQMYIDHTVEWCREVWRVLRDDGSLWLNLGDSYNGSGGAGGDYNTGGLKEGQPKYPGHNDTALKPKDLMGVPWRVALALQQPYVVPTCVKHETDRAWLGAMIDGEGTIGIRQYKSYRKDKKQAYQDGHVVYSLVTNSDIELLDRCIAITGHGKANVKQRAGDTDKRGIVSRRDSWGWRLDGNKAVDVIRAAYPYLIAKKKQAILGYTLDILNKSARAERGNKKVPKEIQDKRQLLYELIKKCNQREEIDLPDWVEEPKQEIQPGWYLRSDIIWHKKNPMPESVTDRPTKSHEYLFLLTKNEKYYYDQDAIREGVTGNTHSRGTKLTPPKEAAGTKEGYGHKDWTAYTPDMVNSRNKRTVWIIATAPYSGAHFATFPPALVEPCIKAGTSEKGVCPECGNPWERVVEKAKGGIDGDWHQQRGTDGLVNTKPSGQKAWDSYTPSQTLGWQPTCDHDLDPIPAIVIDPFSGSGTTLQVARKLGRTGIGLDISADYLDLAKERLGIKDGLPGFEMV